MVAGWVVWMVHWVGEAGAGSTGVANEAAVGESDDGVSGGVNGALREGGEAAHRVLTGADTESSQPPCAPPMKKRPATGPTLTCIT